VEAARKVAIAIGGKPESTIIGTKVKVPCNIGAMVNAVMGSTLDMDDGAMGATGHKGHVGATVVPSSLSVAQRQTATGRDLIEAVLVGYEVALRTGWMLNIAGKPPLAGTVTTYGAAAAAAKLLRLSPGQIADAIGIAEAHCPYPPFETIFWAKGMTKEAMGWAAMTGVTAALLAQNGFSGPDTIYDSPNYAKTPLETLGKEWEILGLYFKPYCACRVCHAAIDGVLALANEYNLNADDILKITVGVPSTRVDMLAKYRPATTWQAQYSTVFLVAAALLDGEVGPEQIAEDRLSDKAILDLADKVTLVADPEVDALRPRSLASRVKIETKDGKKLETFVSTPKGEPQNPLSEEELRTKFKRLAAMAMGSDEVEDLDKCLVSLEDLSSIEELLERLSHCGL